MSNTELVTLTHDLIEAGKTANGGWTAAKLKLIGVDWPPKKGWKSRAVGRRIPKSAYEMFIGRTMDIVPTVIRTGTATVDQPPPAVTPTAHVPLVGYEGRPAVLTKLGFASYRDYLDSDLWRAIRTQVMGKRPFCRSCGETPHEVHHLDYDEPTLRGHHLHNLVPLCLLCHGLIEHDNGRKVTLAEANSRLALLARHMVGLPPSAVRKFVLIPAGTPCLVRLKGGEWKPYMPEKDIRSFEYDFTPDRKMVIARKKKGQPIKAEVKAVRITSAHGERTTAMFGQNPSRRS